MKATIPQGRCPWPTKPLDIEYHDKEWGRPHHDDRALFELLILEGAQAGLSWTTILAKRENYRKAFDGFDARKIANYGAGKTASLMADAGIVRNRLKIAATIQNAKAFLAVQKEFGSFDRYIWSFVGGKPLVNRRRGRGEGIQVHRHDDLLRLHAGDGEGERSPNRLLLPRRVRQAEVNSAVK